jgi:hypothetical protein
MDHQVEELPNLGLEAVRFAGCGGRCGVGHGVRLVAEFFVNPQF